MRRIVLPPDGNHVPASHNPGKSRITSRLPFDRLLEARHMNSLGGRQDYADGFGTTKDPERRPRAAVVRFPR